MRMSGADRIHYRLSTMFRGSVAMDHAMCRTTVDDVMGTLDGMATGDVMARSRAARSLSPPLGNLALGGLALRKLLRTDLRDALSTTAK